MNRPVRALLFRSGIALTLALLVGVFSIGMPSSARGDLVSQTFTPVADAYVSSAKPSTNFGGATRLKMDSSPVLSSYVRFDVSGLTAPATRATLQVYMRTKSKAGFEVRGVADNSWGEKTITYANAPAFASSPSAASGEVRSGRWVTVDITPLVTGNGSVSIALTTGRTAEIDVDSREKANRPRLVVETAGADVTPPSAPGNLALTAATPSTLVVSWSASTDNTGVAGYDIFLNGSKIDSTASTAYSFAGLTCGTNYTLGVEAFDAAGNHSARASVAASTTACSVGTPPPFRFIYNSDSAPAAVASYGWNLIDVSSKSAADQLPSVARALVWVGDYDNTKCSWEVSDTSLKSQVTAGVGDPKIFGYFFSDEPDPYACPNAPAQHKARSDLIHSLDPTTRTVIVLNSNGFSGQRTQDSIDQLPLWKGKADVIGLDPYPCYQRQACDFSWIDKTIQAADAAGLNYWGVAQAFNDSTWRWPTADELTHMLNQWAASKETGSMVFAWTWSGYKLSDHPDLLSALKSFNTTGLVPSDTTPPSAPGSLTKTGATATSVSLSWTPSTDDVGVTGYNVYNGSTLVTTAMSTSYTVGSLTCGMSYTFGVEAKDAAGNVSTRATLSASTSACSTSDTTPPTAPGTPTVTASDGSTITVGWTASIDNVGVAGYDLYVNGAKVTNTTGTQYTFSGLSCGITYTLGVEAFDAAGNRSTRSTVAGATSACPAGDPVITAAGDICGSPTDCAPTEKLLETIAPTRVLTLGDNAYPDGSSSNYANYYAPNWGKQLAKTSPAPGNHEYHTSGAAGYFGYFGSRAPAPYYSFDLGAWHLISLNGEVGVSAGSAQETWLKSDLAAHPAQCILAYWHEPRFSSGAEHGSDADFDTFWRDLYAAGADIVLNGHDHEYERFAPQTPGAVADPKGIREFVVGTGGDSHYSFSAPVANSVIRDNTSFGVLKLTLHAGSYDWQFVPVAGASFTDAGTGTC